MVPAGCGYRAHMRTPTPRPDDPDVVVRRFLDALAAGDGESAVALLTDDVWWHNVGLPVIRGRRRVAAALASMYRRCDLDVRTHHLAVQAPTDPTDPAAPTVVLTERTDVLHRGRLACRFWVCGRFEVRDGLICGWKDYYALGDMAAGLVGGLLRAVTGRGHRPMIAGPRPGPRR